MAGAVAGSMAVGDLAAAAVLRDQHPMPSAGAEARGPVGQGSAQARTAWLLYSHTAHLSPHTTHNEFVSASTH